MPTPSIRRGYVAVQITLTNAAQNYDIFALINTVIQAEGGAAAGASAPGNVRYLGIQSDPANTDTVLIGDALLSATRYGIALPKRLDITTGTNQGNFYQQYADSGLIALMGRYARCQGTAGQKLNIEIETA